MSDLFFNDEIINNSIKTHLNNNLKDYGDVIYAYTIMKKKIWQSIVQYPTTQMNGLIYTKKIVISIQTLLLLKR